MDLDDPPGTRAEWRAIRIFLVAVFSYLFLANAWLGDDAYITFRVVWNFVHGYGLVFNPGERVQAYTHPLWMLLLSVAHAITREFFFTALAVSYALSLAAILVVVGHARTVGAGVLAFLCLISSKAFIDYTASGLEYPLSYLLLALFYTTFLDVTERPVDDRTLRTLGLLAGLAFVNRIDSTLLYAGPLAWLALRGFRRRDERLLPVIIGFGVPVAAWVIFATIYYGFPLPNTYYAKVATGIPAELLWRQGLAYLLNSAAHDPITLGVIGIWAGLAWRSSTPARLSAASALLYVLYTVSVGGDFMSGRFFAMPFLIAVMGAVPAIAGLLSVQLAAIGLVLYNVLMPIVPIKTTGRYDAAWPWRSQNGIKDERGHYHQGTNVLFFGPFRQLPDHTWMREGLSFRSSPERVTVQGSIGFYGLQAGPEKHILDRNALSDPLLARLPVSPRLYFDFYVGHFFRDIPEGYVESLDDGSNRLTDIALREYYEKLRSVTRGPLFSGERLWNIWHLNVGSGRRFAAEYDRQRTIALSIRADNERFAAEAGERDTRAGVIRSVNRPGYLQMGPGIPMKAGSYRARWIGTIDGTSGSIGFVDVWADGQLVARRDITTSEVIATRKQLAEIPFVLPKRAGNLEYRLWINGQVPVTLERVELASQ